MSKCKTVQDELKVRELLIRKKENGQVVERRALKSRVPSKIEAETASRGPAKA